jgi:hypothetical protein
MYLLVDDQGFVYTLDFEVRALASSFDRAVEYLVRRDWSRLEQEQDLNSSGMLGRVWRLDDSF